MTLVQVPSKVPKLAGIPGCVVTAHDFGAFQECAWWAEDENC